MDNEKQTPALRFRGFDGPWEKKKLGDFGTVAMNRRIFKEETSDHGDIPFYKIGTFGGKVDAFISRELFEKYKAAYPYPKPGDILISAAGSIGKTVEYTGKDEYFQDSNIVWLQHNADLDNSFLKCFYAVVKWSGLEGSTISRLYNSNILETGITLPSINEQKKIGKFFADFDGKIFAQEQKIKKAEQFRRAMLSKLFPAEGASEPALRFRGFSGPWNRKPFGEVATVRRGLTYSPENVRKKGIRVLRSSNIQENAFIVANDDVFVNADAVNIPMVKNGDILITAANGSTQLVGKHAIIHGLPERSAVPGGFMLLASSDNTDFLNASMGSAWYGKFISQYVAGGNGALGNLNKADLEKQVIPVPSKEEQKCIGDFFHQLDSYISLQKEKLEKLRRLKAALLEKLFV